MKHVQSWRARASGPSAPRHDGWRQKLGRARDGVHRMSESYPLVCRGLLIAAAMIVLAWIGRANASPSSTSAIASAHSVDAGSESAAAPATQPDVSSRAPVQPSPTPASSCPHQTGAHAARASADDPVYLNVATLEDLRRLPGVGGKRAELVLELRSKIGRFHQLEDLRRIRGFGRTTLKRLRPLIRLDPPTVPITQDAGVDARPR